MRWIILGLLIIMAATSVAYTPPGRVLDQSYTTPHSDLNYTELVDELTTVSPTSKVTVSIKPLVNHSQKVTYDTLTATDKESLRAYYPLLEAELGKYSSTKLHDFGVKNIFLVKNLQLNLSSGTVSVSGAADYTTNSIFIDVTTSQVINNGKATYTSADCEPTQFARGIVHHELWHLYERNNPNKVAAEGAHKQYATASNPIDSFDRCLREDDEFVSEYARTNPSEDRAEQYRARMTLR